MKEIIADIHCHPTMRPYARTFSDKPAVHDRIPRSGWRKMLSRLLGFTRYTQTDSTSLMRGGVNVVFAAIYPMEKEFSRAKQTFKRHYLIESLFNLPTGFGRKKIRTIRNVQRGYFREASQEYHFLEGLNGSKCIKDGNEITYRIISNAEQLQINDSNEDKFTVNIFTSIEGGHALYSSYTDIGVDNPGVRMDVYSNIEKIKNWKYKPVFITLAHHFWNGFCGHTESIPGFLEQFNLVSQKAHINEGISSFGNEVIHKLLNKKNGRILIDVKHMSYQSRKEYYNILDTHYADENIPIIASHACVRGSKEKASLFMDKPVNFTDEEIVRIAKSGGLFGVQLDKNRIASSKELRKFKRCITKEMVLQRASLLIWRNVAHIAEVLDKAGLQAWNIQCIGSDYDGIINPINGIWTAAEYKKLKKYLYIHAERYMKGMALFRLNNINNRQISAERIIDSFMGENVITFLHKFQQQCTDTDRVLKLSGRQDNTIDIPLKKGRAYSLHAKIL